MRKSPWMAQQILAAGKNAPLWLNASAWKVTLHSTYNIANTLKYISLTWGKGAIISRPKNWLRKIHILSIFVGAINCNECKISGGFGTGLYRFSIRFALCITPFPPRDAAQVKCLFGETTMFMHTAAYSKIALAFGHKTFQKKPDKCLAVAPWSKICLLVLAISNIMAWVYYQKYIRKN